MFPHRRFLKKRLVIKLILIFVPFLIIVNELTRKTITNNIISDLHFSPKNKNTTESISHVHPQPEEPSKDFSHVCDIPLNRKKSLARRFPHIIIIGFGKAGTRALYKMIRMHPDVVGPGSELRFFSDDVKYRQGIRAYINLMSPTYKTQKTLEKSPDYIIKPGAVERLKKALDHCHRSHEIKFIVVLRDPFKRAVSEYLHWKLHLKYAKKRKLANFEERARVKKSGEVNNVNAQVNASIYSYHVKNWLKIFEKKKICFVDGDTLVKNPYSVVKKLEKCLELREFITPKHFYFNKDKGFYCPVDAKGVPKCLGLNKGRTHPNIDEHVEMKLRIFFEPFNKELYNMTGINFGWMTGRNQGGVGSLK